MLKQQRRLSLFLLFLLLAHFVLNKIPLKSVHIQTAPNADPFAWDPVADEKAVVIANHARFTVLTPWVIRCEWDLESKWQDKATIIAVKRKLPVPKFTVDKSSTTIHITTDFIDLTYRYDSDNTFNSSNIKITTKYEFENPATKEKSTRTSTWNAVQGQETEGNLFGTIRTLDGNRDKNVNFDCKTNMDRSQHCTYGVISRNGYAVIDDTHAPSFDRSDIPTTNDTWPWFNGNSWQAQPSQCDKGVEKRQCGKYGVSQQQCQALGCCYKETRDRPSDPICYYHSQSTQDLYFFGHGLNYKQALKDFTSLSGPIPLPPRYVFGVFFSRYWAYASYDQKEIMREYSRQDIPLDVLVTDMDWHITAYKRASRGERDQAGQNIGWSGFTFDDHLFVDHAAFLKWCKQLGVKNTLNIHPASGMQPWEEKYADMARANGIDPATGKYVPFNATSKLFVSTWFDQVMRPFEVNGIDLWWLDWQQGEDWIQSPPGLNPTIVLNYQFYTDPYHWQVTNTRPALLHRWGGLGNHRYQIGFSGDVIPNWETLNLQTYFTPTASNVGYTYWSHDIGGHVAPPDPELYTRWVQWGAFSPIFRTHCTKNADNDRRIYTYPWTYYTTLRNFIKLRQTLVPYIYTQARFVYETSVGSVLPLYYNHPYHDESYQFNHEYYFGTEMVIAPVAAPIKNDTGMTEWSYWVPPGTWTNMFSLEKFTGPKVEKALFTLDEMPALVKEGSIIPMLPESVPAMGQAKLVPTQIKWLAVIGGGKQGSGILYDDHGDDAAYSKSNEYAWTKASYVVADDGTSLEFVISQASGSFPTMPNERQYELHLRGVLPATSVSVNGADVPLELYNDLLPVTTNKNTHGYDGASLSVVIKIGTPQSTKSDVKILVKFANAIGDIPSNKFVGRLNRFIKAKNMLDDQWGTRNSVYQDDYPSLLYAAGAGEKLSSAAPGDAIKVLNEFEQNAKTACEQIEKIENLLPELKSKLKAQLC